MEGYKAGLVGAILLALPRVSAADAVQFDLSDAVVGEDGKATVTVTLHANGNAVTGIQNDILFDTRVVDLANLGSCRIDPAIAFSAPGCEEEPPVGPCLTLNRALHDCGDIPQPSSCRGQPPYVSRLRALIADFDPPQIVFPDGVLYRCTFDIVDPEALPAFLKNSFVVAADSVGIRFEAVGADGSISNDGSLPPPWTPAPTPTAALVGGACETDFDCADRNCDWSLPQGVYPGSCGALRTPTPEPVEDPCLTDDDCPEGLHCNDDEGVCCDQHCPNGSCRLSGQEGICVVLATPTPTRIPAAVVVYYDITEPDASGRFALHATMDGDNVAGMQADIVFNGRAVRLVGDSCRLNPELSDTRAGCEQFPAPFPCLNQFGNIANCGQIPTGGCAGRSPDEDRFRGVIRHLDISNELTIPAGAEIFTCEFEVIDKKLLPSEIAIFHAGGASPDGDYIAIEPRAIDGTNGADMSVLTVESGPAAGGGGDGCALSAAGGSGGLWLLAGAGLMLFPLWRIRGKSSL